MKERIKKILSLLMVAAMLTGGLSVTTAYAANGNDKASDDPLSEVTVSSAQRATDTDEDKGYVVNYDKAQLATLTGAESYSKYLEEYADVEKADQTVEIDAVKSCNKNDSTAEIKVVDAKEYGDGSIKGEALMTGDAGNTVFDVDIPKTGKYAMRLTYASVVQNDEKGTEISTTIERMLYIDGDLPFSETRYLYFPRYWQYEYATDDEGNYIYQNEDGDKFSKNPDGSVVTEKQASEQNFMKTFIADKNGNDTRPRRWETAKWQTYYVRDWLGYEIDPFEFYFSQGHHQITLVSNRESMIISGIELYRYDTEPVYDEWLADMKSKGVEEVTGVAPIKVQAENPDSVSIQNVIPNYDRTSSLTEPQDPARIKYNILDNATVNNWMKYKVTVPKSGLYSVSFRFRQNALIGLFSSRRMRINGEIQFREASYLRFMYNTDFQTTYANNGKQDFLFYFEEGENEVELEIVLGEMVQYVYRIVNIINELDAVYQKMLMITGPVPDSYRDYGFHRLVPDCIMTMADAANELYDIEDSIVEMTGEKGDQTNTLETIAILLEKMATDEYEIAPNFLTFKNYIISLSDWLYSALSQPCKIDYFVIGSVDEKLPQAVSNSFQKIGFEISAFVASFTMDYTTIGFSDDNATATTDTIEMWSISDRETMLIHRYIVDNYFTPKTGISLRIKVISAGLTEAILAGIGPDVSFMDTINTITFGMRTALLPMENYEGFNEVMAQFPECMMDKLTMEGQDKQQHTYGLPTTLVVPMAFYRIDVLNDLGIEVPNTWNELLAEMPALLNNNLDVGLPTGLVGTQLFVYQEKGGDIYTDNGYRTNLDSTQSLSSFKTLCEMFQKYGCPVAYDITRFRTGEIPIMIAEDFVTTYNQLMTFYELRGLWTMAPVIGTVQADGSVNRTAVCNTQAAIIPRGGYDPNVVWKFVSWYCGSESQTRQARETVAVSAPTSKFSTANKEALLAQKWTDQEREAVAYMLDNLAAVPEYPGSYIITQYVQFAFLDAVNNGTNPADAMLSETTYINKEISRKRKEFGLDYYEITYGMADNNTVTASDD